MYRILKNQRLVPNLYHLVVEVPEVARSAKPGQFVMVIPDEKGERIPLNLADFDKDKGTIELVYLVVGVSTRKLSRIKPGSSLAGVAGPLGRPTEIGRKETVFLVGGCFGPAGLYPIARELKLAGNKVIFLTEARDHAYVYWEDKIKAFADHYFNLFRRDCFDSGKTLETAFNMVKLKYPELSRVLVMGCDYLLHKISTLTSSSGIKIEVYLTPIMVDGTGMCGACRVTVSGKTYFACVDGPVFDGHGLDWVEYFARRQAFLPQEQLALGKLEILPPEQKKT
ncbi:MAG: sulfide/dihydroorotate dehydrogenase-like FAD/NAD-binding protein [Candidatus Aminicenantes bacterium]|nr:sulfide/dihydroorotate dehydrogenase-like FAD/NAD-binding protein [Candidatus Aminicenantes bacterium]